MLNTFAEIAIHPMNRRKEPTRPFNIRLPIAVFEALEAAATEQDRSVNYLIVKCVEQCYPASTTETAYPEGGKPGALVREKTDTDPTP